jgi:hypothetical protein
MDFLNKATKISNTQQAMFKHQRRASRIMLKGTYSLARFFIGADLRRFLLI